MIYGDHIYFSDSTEELHAFRPTPDGYDDLDSGRNITMPIDGVRGLHRQRDILWMAGPDDDRVYAMRMTDGRRQRHLEFDLGSETGSPHGIWSNGVTVFVVDASDEELHAYHRIRDNATGTVFASGTGREGDALACVATGLSDDGLPDPPEFGYRWQRSGLDGH